MAPRVSVSLPVYNGENYIRQALDAILAQDFADFELIITDNASVDDTQTICTRYAAQDNRIRYVRNPENIGAAANYNLGFELTRGAYFKWNSHDDFVNPQYLRLGVEALDRTPDAVVAYGDIVHIDGDGHAISDEDIIALGIPTTVPDLTALSSLPPAERFKRMIRVGGADNVMFGVMRTDALRNGSLHKHYYMSDRALIAELSLRGTFIPVDGMVLYNRDHPARSTRITDKSQRAGWQNPTLAKRRRLEHLPLLAHQLSIAWHHRGTTPLSHTVPSVLAWAMTPIRLGWYAMELIGTLSPTLRSAISQSCRPVVRAITQSLGGSAAANGRAHKADP